MIWVIDLLCAFVLEYYTVRRAALSVAYALTASSIFSITFVLSLFAYRTFDEENLDELREQIPRVLVSVVISVLLTAFVFTLFRSKLAFRPTTLTSAILAVAIPVANHLAYKLLLSKRKPKEYVMLVTPAQLAILKPLIDEVKTKARRRFAFKAFVDVSETIDGLEKVLGHNIDRCELLFCDAPDSLRVREWLTARGLDIPMTHVSEVIEETLKRIPIPLLEMFREYYELVLSKRKESPAKRIFDFTLALIGTIVTLPLMLLAVLLVFLEDRGPVIFKQLRVGKHGRPFIFTKVRTLRELKDQGTFGKLPLENGTPNDGIERRMLKVGRLLRLTRLDELPQFWLVLKGDMSIVGPRPEMVEYHQMFGKQIPFYPYRLNVRPGLTGWAQINYRHTSTLEEYVRKTEYDLYYIKNANLLLDLQIILQTLEAIFWRRGAR